MFIRVLILFLVFFKFPQEKNYNAVALSLAQGNRIIKRLKEKKKQTIGKSRRGLMHDKRMNESPFNMVKSFPSSNLKFNVCSNAGNDLNRK